MSTTLKFGKFRGKEIAEVAKTKEGQSWLNWYLGQEGDPKYAEANNRLKSEIRGVLSGGEITTDEVANQFGGTVVKKETSTPRPQVPTDAQYLQRIIELLEKIEVNTQKWVD